MNLIKLGKNLKKLTNSYIKEQNKIIKNKNKIIVTENRKIQSYEKKDYKKYLENKHKIKAIEPLYTKELFFNEFSAKNNINLTRDKFSKYTCGKVCPSIDMLIAFKNFFRVSLDDLMGLSNNNKILKYTLPIEKNVVTTLLSLQNDSILTRFINSIFADPGTASAFLYNIYFNGYDTYRNSKSSNKKEILESNIYNKITTSISFSEIMYNTLEPIFHQDYEDNYKNEINEKTSS